MKKLFTLNVTTMESNWIWLFYHDNKTQEEFEKDVNSLIIKYADDIVEKYQDTFITVTRYIEFISDKLIELEYTKAETISYSFEDYGIFSVSVEDGKIHNIIGKELSNKIENHNTNICNNI